MTRPREQAVELTSGLQALGAEVSHLPLIAIGPPEDWSGLDRALAALSTFDWVALTSANAVMALFERLRVLDVGLPPLRWAVVGKRTAELLEERGQVPDLVAEPATAERLAELMRQQGVAGQRVLFPRSDRAREVLPQALRSASAEVEAPVAYRTLSSDVSSREIRRLLEQGGVWITLTSPSTWHELLAALKEAPLPSDVRLAAIGPTTAAAVRASGYEPACVAEPPGVQGLLEAMTRADG